MRKIFTVLACATLALFTNGAAVASQLRSQQYGGVDVQYNLDQLSLAFNTLNTQFGQCKTNVTALQTQLATLQVKYDEAKKDVFNLNCKLNGGAGCNNVEPVPVPVPAPTPD